ncbi:MAG: DUF5009 domain-containing protein [Phycisphaerae bacterium]|nr:DUF5009 domain-containing protein [Phycisphaerae bacterium]
MEPVATAPVSSPAAAASKTPAESGRLVSLDALRGFDMFWIVGGERIFHALATWTGAAWLVWLSGELHHPEWNGFKFYDLIFPLFLFISGVTMPFSLTRRMERGESKRALYLRVIRRGLILVVLGFLYGGMLKFEWETMRWPSVLGRIGLAYLFAGLIVLRCGLRGQILWMLSLVLAYWAAMTLIPVPVYAADALEKDEHLATYVSLAGYIDWTLLPGRLYKVVHDPEGLLSTVPAISTALLGAMTGAWLRRPSPRPILKAVGLAIAGAACLGIGKLWDPWFPINKNLWSSSFVFYAGGWSLLFLSVFYFIIDVCRLRRWAFFFVVIGVNPITIYFVANRLVDFKYTATFLFDGALRHVDEPLRAVLWASGVILLEWLFLLFLYRKRVFLRV